jgi:hypothetical protein
LIVFPSYHPSLALQTLDGGADADADAGLAAAWMSGYRLGCFLPHQNQGASQLVLWALLGFVSSCRPATSCGQWISTAPNEGLHSPRSAVSCPMPPLKLYDDGTQCWQQLRPRK